MNIKEGTFGRMVFSISQLEDSHKVEHIFFNFFLYRTPQIFQPKAEGDLSMGAYWLVVCETHHLGLAIIF